MGRGWGAGAGPAGLPPVGAPHLGARRGARGWHALLRPLRPQQSPLPGSMSLCSRHRPMRRPCSDTCLPELYSSWYSESPSHRRHLLDASCWTYMYEAPCQGCDRFRDEKTEACQGKVSLSSSRCYVDEPAASLPLNPWILGAPWLLLSTAGVVRARRGCGVAPGQS